VLSLLFEVVSVVTPGGFLIPFADLRLGGIGAFIMVELNVLEVALGDSALEEGVITFAVCACKCGEYSVTFSWELGA